MKGLERTDTLLVLDDPQLRAIGVLIETSMWETAICPVQRSDFRNFAHGRHVWLTQRPEHTWLLALTGRDGRPIWSPIDRLLPAEVRRTSFDFGGAGRFTGQVEAIQVAADDTASAIGSIGQTIARMSEIASEVAAAADQQGRASQEIARAISCVAADGRTVSESVGGLQKAAASNETQAAQVRNSALQVNAGAHTACKARSRASLAGSGLREPVRPVGMGQAPRTPHRPPQAARETAGAYVSIGFDSTSGTRRENGHSVQSLWLPFLALVVAPDEVGGRSSGLSA
jgi:hypothetical protein